MGSFKGTTDGGIPIDETWQENDGLVSVVSARYPFGDEFVEIPLKENGKLDVSGAVGTDGNLYIVKDLGMKEPYNGFVPIVSGEIAEDITSYYATSEQIPTVCALGVLVNPDLTVKKAGGYILQLLPFTEDEIITKIEQNLARVKPVTQLLDEGMDIEDIRKIALKNIGRRR